MKKIILIAAGLLVSASALAATPCPNNKGLNSAQTHKRVASLLGAPAESSAPEAQAPVLKPTTR